MELDNIIGVEQPENLSLDLKVLYGAFVHLILGEPLAGIDLLRLSVFAPEDSRIGALTDALVKNVIFNLTHII